MFAEPSITRLPNPARITDHDFSVRTVPLVSVFVWSFNNAIHLSESIDRILEQVTDFPVEIVVHDDASTDSSSKLLLDYERQYPALFQNILQTQNQYSRGNCLLNPVFFGTSGVFVALNHADDYWTDPTKLQRQVDLLLAHPDASGCFHRADGLFEDSGELIPGHFGPDTNKATYGIDDLLPKGNFVPTCSILFRKNVFSPVPEWKSRPPHGDITLLCIAAMKGPLLYLDRSMAVYRKHSGGMHSSQSFALQVLNAIETHHIIGENLGITHLDSYREGLEFRRRQLKELLDGTEKDIAHLRDQLALYETTLSGVRASKTFRLGRTVSRWRDQLKHRFTGN